jgi:hypothetical protein
LETKGANNPRRTSFYDKKQMPLVKLIPIIDTLEPVSKWEPDEEIARKVFFSK